MKEILNRQIKPIFKMMYEIFDHINDKLYGKLIKKYQFWKFLYHPVYWLDYHLSKKDEFQPPDFHTDGMNSLDINTENIPNLNTLFEYTKYVENKISSFLNSIILEENFDKRTKLDIFIGQIRHSAYHIGLLHAIILYEKGIMINTIGPEFPNHSKTTTPN